VTMQILLDEDVHLQIHCSGCGRNVEMTPTEACDLLGLDCTSIQARDRLRCTWCGATGEKRIDVRPCNKDISDRKEREDVRRVIADGNDPSGHWARRLAELEAAWERRRPKDGLKDMCNAFRLKTPISTIARDLAELSLPLRFENDAMPNDWPEIEMTRPTNTLPVLKPIEATAPSQGLQVSHKRWWLVPFYHRGETKAWKAMCTNARAETVATSRTFKGPFERRRCLVPADAYYEWTGEKGDKTRWRVERADGDWFSFAGLWDRAETAEGMLESFAIITTEAGEDAKAVHSRQPVILGKGEMGRWLDLAADASVLLRPSPQGTLIPTLG
jgi:putative SOS response-associated peptidase YedK/DNA-directed RNA polymerase subunit RPC12/RpoP